MLLHIADVLSAEEASACRAALEQAGAPVDRRTMSLRGTDAMSRSTGWSLAEDHPVARDLGDKIIAVLERNPLFMGAALPQRVFPPVFHRYEPGQRTAGQVEPAVRQVAGTSHRLRTDLSATLYLSAPEEYEGGELLIDDRYGTQSVKLPAGHMILYPSTSLNQVQPVTRGSMAVAVFWVQSMIRDDGQRSVLFDLDMAIQRLSAEQPDHPSAVQLTGVYHNLIRMWAEV